MTQVLQDQWLSEMLHTQAFKVELDSSGETIESALLPILNRKPLFLFILVSTQDTQTIRQLGQMGFYLVDTRVTYEKKITPYPEEMGHVRFAQAEDRHRVGEVAQHTFVYSRFHCDPAIPNELADQLKHTWVDNYFKGERGHQMVVATVQGEVAGFLQLLENQASRVVTIDLIGVDKRFQGQGLAAQMIQFAEQYYHPDFHRIKASTQVANIPSVNLYEKLGFRLTQSDYIFHYHGAQS